MMTKPDIKTIIENEGIELKRRGRDYWANCPFHTDKTPSFKINLERQTWYCFGENEGGDVISFIMKRHNVTFKEALHILGIRQGRRPKPNPAEERKRKLLKAYESWKKDHYLNLCEQAIEIHALRIKANSKAPLPEYLGWFMAEQLAKLPAIEHALDIMQTKDDEQIIEIFKTEFKA